MPIAVLQNGEIRPLEPLPADWREGQRLQIEAIDAPAKEDEASQRLRAASTLSEWMEAAKQLPDDDGGYNIVDALNRNRSWSGEEPLNPKEPV